MSQRDAHVPGGLELRAGFEVVVELAVLDRDDRALLVLDWLVAASTSTMLSRRAPRRTGPARRHGRRAPM